MVESVVASCGRSGEKHTSALRMARLSATELGVSSKPATGAQGAGGAEAVGPAGSALWHRSMAEVDGHTLGLRVHFPLAWSTTQGRIAQNIGLIPFSLPPRTARPTIRSTAQALAVYLVNSFNLLSAKPATISITYQEFVKPLLADQTLPISQSIPAGKSLSVHQRRSAGLQTPWRPPFKTWV